MTSFSVFLKARIWEVLLCSLAAGALAFTVCTGYHAGRGFQENPLLFVVVPLVLTFVLCLITYSTFSALLGGALFAVACVIAAVAAAAISSADNFLDDVPGNVFYAVVTFELCSVAVFVLARRRLTCILLLVVGLFVCGLFEYLYWQGHLLPAVLFGLSSAGLVAYRTYQRSLLASDSDGIAFGTVSAVGVALPLVATACAAGVFFLAIAPLHPGNMEVKLITEHYRANVIEVTGLESIRSLFDYDKTSSDADQNNEPAGENDKREERQRSEEDASPQDDGQRQEARSFAGGTGDGERNEDMMALGIFDPSILPFIIAALVVFAIVGSIAAKRAMRRKRYRKMLAQPADKAASDLYLFFLKHLERCKIKKPPAQTLEEFASSASMPFAAFEHRSVGEEALFPELTRVFARVSYGGGGVGQEELGLFERYYEALYRNMRCYMGKFRYLRHFFFI